ncbi:MAG: hypothetical protein JOY61_04815 [Chloroflexi bacterium]|nr:hypothetical protein [Chloroflexota bacterium]
MVAVTRSETSATVFLDFRGVRDAPHMSDKDARIRVMLSVDHAIELRRRLSELLPSQVD